MAARNALIAVNDEGTIMTITVDLTKNLGPSTSGKTTIIGTTGGSEKITVPQLKNGKPVKGEERTISVGLNVFS